jgi:uncharacterized protein (TIGR02145 family)
MKIKQVKLFALILFCIGLTGLHAQTVKDFEGNVYKTITIGTQTWMADNLRTTKYRNGDAIPEVTDSSAWINLITGAYCNYNNTRNNDTIVSYGRFYNLYAVTDNRNICPTGWHVSTDAEWTTLTDYLGGASVAGDKLKEKGTTHWESPNAGATNEIGFTALPGAIFTRVNHSATLLCQVTGGVLPLPGRIAVPAPPAVEFYAEGQPPLPAFRADGLPAASRQSQFPGDFQNRDLAIDMLHPSCLAIPRLPSYECC